VRYKITPFIRYKNIGKIVNFSTLDAEGKSKKVKRIQMTPFSHNLATLKEMERYFKTRDYGK
jgi:hypothetical protein